MQNTHGDVLSLPRPISYRAISLNEKIWVYGMPGERQDFDMAIFEPEEPNKIPVVWGVISCTVGQNTGMVDSAGQEVFEGDRCWATVPDDNGNTTTREYTVVFDRYGFRLSPQNEGNSMLLDEPLSVHVIGSIHDVFLRGEKD